ncbi:hypothetical protein BGZ46_005988 [Entomortierella lignicola]|nr:hypothetical protein BGZ46_005988 [Entomortierella lignicola]
MHPALHIEEVRTSIGEFLNPSSIIACARCCHEWHDSFTPLLWRHLNITQVSRIPREQLEKNKHRILALTVHIFSSPPYFSVQGCSNLSRIIIQGGKYTYHPYAAPQWRIWDQLIRDHCSTLQHLSLLDFHAIEFDSDFCEGIATCNELQSLTLEGRIARMATFLWDACKTITEIKIRGTDIPKSNGTVTQINRVAIENTFTTDGIMQFLEQCPKLQHLSWRTKRRTAFPLSQLESGLADGLWPHLEELDMDGVGLKDFSLAKTFGNMNKLTTLLVPNSEFGSISLTSLKKHNSFLKTLDLRGCGYVNGSAIQDILSSIVSLESLTVGKIMYMDIVNGSAWVSLKLQRLRMCIDMQNFVSDKSNEDTIINDNDFEAHQQIVYDRLSTLTQLEVLDIHPYPYYPEITQTLDLRVSSGLETLSSLKKLVDFSFKGTRQDMSMKDVRWIIENLANLRKISGRFTNDPKKYYEMKLELNSHGILVYD